MTLTRTNTDPLDAGNGTESLTVSLGSLGLREDVLRGFLAIRSQHQQLEGLLHQMMRKVVLPRCREIGAELDRIRSLYPKGKKGPGGQASGFFRDAEICTGLKKRQVLNYIQIATGWHKLIEHMAELPEGAAPIQSMRGALAALQKMNRPERPALPGTDGAVDVDAEAVAGSDLPGKRRTRYVHSTREKVLPALTALKATPVGLKHEGELEVLLEALNNLLDAMEQEEAEGEWAEVEPSPAAAALAPAASLLATGQRRIEVIPPEELADEDRLEEIGEAPAAFPAGGQAGKTPATLPALYPTTPEGMEALDLAIAEHGSGAELGRSLGLGVYAVGKHRKRSRAKLGLP
jgi:hypothetical protein